MKTKLSLVCGFLAVMFSLSFGACSAAAQGQRLTGTDAFSFRVINGGTAYSVSKSTATEGTVNIPAYYRPNADSDYLPVREIGSFIGCINIIKITIPASVTSISYSAFLGCTSLASITIPASVTSIGHSAFQRCTSLANITIPASVTHIGKEAFEGTAWLNSQSDGLVYAGKVLYIYKGKEKMPANTVINNIRDDTIAIADRAFSSCTNLTSITIPAGVKSIGGGAFYNCTSLTSITIPASVTHIGGGSGYDDDNNYDYGSFYGCTSLETVTFAAGSQLKTIGDYTFSGCTSLTSITIPASVTHIGQQAFSPYFSGTRTSLKTVNFAEGSQLEYIGFKAFSGCTSLTSITIPASVTKIGEFAFMRWTPSQTINILGHASQAAADAAWIDWRNYCNAKIVYQGE